MDITDRKRAEEALRECEAELARVARLTTMGELAASKSPMRSTAARPQW